MLMKPFFRLFQRSLLVLSVAGSALPSAVALAVDAKVKISEGSPFTSSEFGLTLTPPTGWQILSNYRGKTLVLQPVPKTEKISDFSKPIYNPNITVAVMHQSRPIDETEALSLRKKLEIDFGQAPGVTDFQILEHRFIDYRQKADAILIYTAFQLNNFPMSQMHIFLSGSKNATLLTYTDLADSFQSNEGLMTQAWNAMLSTDLQGVARKRYEDIIYGASAAGVFLLAASLVLILRRRSAYRMYEVEEDKLYRDDSASEDEDSAVTGIATAVAPTSKPAESTFASDAWNMAVSQVSTSSRAKANKRLKSSLPTAW
jgi:hypothetical protein